MDLRRSILLAVFLAGVCAVITGALWQLRVSAGDPGDDTPAAAPAHAETEALGILRAWDARRARAWADGDVPALDRLYTPRSRTGAVDRAMLRSYLRRGLVVEGMATQVLAADVRDSDATHLTLAVTDRLASGTAVGASGRHGLPRDRATSHSVSLVRVDGEWLVSEVR